MNKMLDVSIQKEILRLKYLGISKSKVAKLLKKDRETILRYWKSDLILLESEKPQWVEQIDWDYLEKELKKVPRKILHEELKESIPLPSYQAFYQYLRNNQKEIKIEVTIKINRVPGASVDWSGDSIDILNPATGELNYLLDQ